MMRLIKIILSLTLGAEVWPLAGPLYHIPGWEAGLGTAIGAYCVLSGMDWAYRVRRGRYGRRP